MVDEDLGGDDPTMTPIRLPLASGIKQEVKTEPQIKKEVTGKESKIG